MLFTHQTLQKTSCSVCTHSRQTTAATHRSFLRHLPRVQRVVCERKMDTQRPTQSAVAISSHSTKNNTSHASSDLLLETVKRAPSTEGSFCRSPRDLVKNNSQPVQVETYSSSTAGQLGQNTTAQSAVTAGWMDGSQGAGTTFTVTDWFVLVYSMAQSPCIYFVLINDKNTEIQK